MPCYYYGSSKKIILCNRFLLIEIKIEKSTMTKKDQLKIQIYAPDTSELTINMSGIQLFQKCLNDLNQIFFFNMSTLLGRRSLILIEKLLPLHNICHPHNYLWNIWSVILLLNSFLLNVPFWSPWKHQKTFGFLMFSGGSKGNIRKKRLKELKSFCTYLIPTSLLKNIPSG